MEMVNNVLFYIISTLVLSPDKAISQPLFSKCLQNSTDPNITHLTTYGNWCYFIVDGSWIAANEPTGNGSYLFNISMAREICGAEDATILIIHNMEENKHISDEYHNLSTYLALGMKQASNGPEYTYKWDDGSNLSFKHPNWTKSDEQAAFTVLGSGGGWKNLGPIHPELVGVVCQQLLQPLTNNISIPDATEIICDRNQTPEVIETAIFEHGNTKACYFILTDGSADSNRQETGTGLFFFNITAAQDACTKHNATLPSIHSIDEDSFMNFKLIYKFYAIGLKQVTVDGGYEYKWDDGSEFDYQPVWINKYQPASYTLSYEHHSGGPRQWRNSLDQMAFDQSILVMCKQSYPPKPKPQVRNISICNDPHKQNYSKTAVFRGQWCYFVIKEATNMSHTIISERSYFFYPSTAREICKNEDATLPTISSAPEEKFIMENFKSELFKVESGGISKITRNAEAILLGLNQMRNVSDYHWDDATPFSFESLNWTNKAQYALYTVMHLNQSAWMNLNSVALTAPIGVLCKKPHNDETSLQSTPEPVTSSPPPTPLCDLDTTQFPEIVSKQSFDDGKNKSCYFFVQGADSKANKKAVVSYFFNITIAREICAQYNATLPSIHSIATEEYFARDYALGLQQVSVDDGFEYKWDDGSEFDYEPLWIAKFLPADNTVSLKGSPIKWRSALSKEGLDSKISVICQQPYPPRPKPSMGNISNCDRGRKHNYAKTAIFNQSCYFVVNRATETTNEVIQFVNFIFNPTKAREICQKEYATLPTIPNPEEHQFIMNNFHERGLFNAEWKYCDGRFCPGPQKFPAHIIMLDLKQMKNVNDYHWVDNSQFSFEPGNWKDKTKYAFFTTMNLYSSEPGWVNYETEDVFGTPAGVLCKQPYFPEPVVTTTEVITTTAPTTVIPSTPPPPPPIETEPEPEPETSAPESPTHSPPRSPKPKPSSLSKEANKCLPENSHHYTKVAQSGKHFCYFIVPDLNEYCNNKNELNGLFKFDDDQAHIVCIDHGGRLPILFNQEDKFILDNFNDSSQFKSVALGLQGIRDRTGGVRVTWYDGVELAYFERGHLITQIEKFNYAVMYRSGGSIKWRPGGVSERDPVGVVCQQVLSGGCGLVKPILVFSLAMGFLMMR